MLLKYAMGLAVGFYQNGGVPDSQGTTHIVQAGRGDRSEKGQGPRLSPREHPPHEPPHLGIPHLRFTWWTEYRNKLETP